MIDFFLAEIIGYLCTNRVKTANHRRRVPDPVQTFVCKHQYSLLLLVPLINEDDMKYINKRFVRLYCDASRRATAPVRSTFRCVNACTRNELIHTNIRLAIFQRVSDNVSLLQVFHSAA
jgi:hypothetical protein